MKVLVTGGGGFLGSAVCRQLAALGHEVIAFQRSPAKHLESHGVHSVEGDVSDYAQLSSAANGCGAIVHTAGKAGIWGRPQDFRRINVDGTANVIRACREHTIALLVHTSSPSVVHAGGDIEGADESLPLATEFSAPYPETKAEAEKLVIAGNDKSLKTTALRPHLIWGPGDPHILPRLLAKARGGKLALPAPDKIIDTIFVENAALAHVKALEELSSAARCAGKAYFVTNNEPMPQGEIIGKLLAALGVDVKIRAVPAMAAMTAGALCETAWRTFKLKGEPPVTRFSVEQLATAHWFNTAAAKNDFGYTPPISIAEGLKILSAQGL
ncbi:MAG: NAD-dependent epimerase/dehydratase family protein [Xanthomonadales bacterium]|jgi:nucleoside-diphosphate-sugar epimerase|nr:NAD-dependent epimerase/dehydratase family protein [Xanthomonadales bacterium]